MSSHHLVDPELLEALAAFPAIVVSEETLPAMRQAMVEIMAAAPSADGVKVEERLIPGPEGAPAVRVLVLTPEGAPSPAPAYLHIHGGGYVAGAADFGVAPLSFLAAELKCVVVTVDYRLAPETPFPGGVEDCYAALSWLQDHAAEIGADPARIAIGGESAGGGLTAALALLARDRGRPPLKLQVLIYPMLDDRTAVDPEPNAFTGEFVWVRGSNLYGWSALLAGAPGGPDVSPYAAAARATSLEGLPPTFISVGALDLFLEEDLDYARRLARAGVPTELHVYPGAFHAFNLAAAATVAQAFERDWQAALARALA